MRRTVWSVCLVGVLCMLAATVALADNPIKVPAVAVLVHSNVDVAAGTSVNLYSDLRGQDRFGSAVPVNTANVSSYTIRDLAGNILAGATLSSLGVVMPLDTGFFSCGSATTLTIQLVYTLPEATAIETTEAAKAYPNPWKAGMGWEPAVVFPGLAPGARVRVWNMLGQCVMDYTVQGGLNYAVWDIKNRAGSDVASGVYKYIVTLGSQHAAGKLTIIR